MKKVRSNFMQKIGFIGNFLLNPFVVSKESLSQESLDLILKGRVERIQKEGYSLDEALCFIANDSQLDTSLRILASKTLTADKF